MANLIRLACLLAGLITLRNAAGAQLSLPSGGHPVLGADALLTTPVGGLERTQSSADVIPVTGTQAARGLRVRVGANAPETNATQLTLPIAAPVSQGDVLLASFLLRGATAGGALAHMELLFERTVDPWTKSVTRGATSAKIPTEWKRVLVPFTAAEAYRPGEAMVSLRFAFGPQTVEIAGLDVEDYGKSKTLEELTRLSIGANPLGQQNANVQLAATKQTLVGFGGDFTAPRYGSTTPSCGTVLAAPGEPDRQRPGSCLRSARQRLGINGDRWRTDPHAPGAKQRAHRQCRTSHGRCSGPLRGHGVSSSRCRTVIAS